MNQAFVAEAEKGIHDLDQAMQQVRLKAMSSTIRALRQQLVQTRNLYDQALSLDVPLDLVNKLDGWNIDAKLLLQRVDPEDF